MKSGARTDLASKDARSEISIDQAAELMGVSPTSVDRAKKRMREEPSADHSLPVDLRAIERAVT